MSSMRSWRWHGGRDGETIVWGNVIDSIQTVLALASSITWLVGEYYPYNDEVTVVRLQFAFSVLYVTALLAQVSSSGLRQQRYVWLVFDTVTSLPIFYQAYQLGYYDGDQQGWLTFITALRIPLQWFVVSRFLRVVRMFKRTTLRSGSLVITSDLVRSVTALLFTVICFCVVGGGLVQLIENSSSDGNHVNTWQSLYTVFGVITVIGWGNSPATAPGQVIAMLILLAALIVLPLQINNLVQSVSDYYKLGLAYTGRAPHIVMVVYPTMTPSDLNSFLREVYSFHSGLSVFRCVLLGTGGESHRRSLLRWVATSPYWSSVSYVVGSPSSVSSLQKVAVQHASAVFLLASAWFVDPGQELADDEQSLLQAITIKHYCPSVPLIISLNKPRSRAHVLWFELCKFPNVQAVCLNEIKLQLLATQAMVPGLLGLIANLLQFGGRAGTEYTRSWWWAHGHWLGQDDELLTTPAVLGSWPLSFDVPPDRPVDRAIQRSWKVQYITGFLQELRACPLPPALSGLSFAEVAAALYERLLIVLLAVGRRDGELGQARVILNPGYGDQVTVEQGDLLCLMVQSAEHARAVSEVHWDRDAVRGRWLRFRAQTSSVDVQFTSLGSPVSPAIPVAFASHYVNRSTSREPVIQRTEQMTKGGQEFDSLKDRTLAAFKDDRPHIVELSSLPEHEVKRDDNKGPITPQPTVSAPVDDTPSPRSGGGGREGRVDSTDPFTGHIVLCGFIDSRVVSFIRRFRASDSRPLVLVFDNAVCYPLPAIVQEFITANFRDIHLIYASHTFKARHQRSRVYLSYSDCCFGHQHTRRRRRGKKGEVKVDSQQPSSRPSDRAMASCVNGRGGHVESQRTQLNRPTMNIDEFGIQDRSVIDSLVEEGRRTRRRQKAHGRVDNNQHMARTVNLPRYCRLHDSDSEAEEMDHEAVLKYANWYRRACVHTADMVLILASSYTAPPDSTSSNGATALNDDTAIHRDHVYITSLFQASQRSPTEAVKDEQTRADQHSLIMYAGIQAYLRQCRVAGCSAMMRVKSHPPPPVVVELLYHVNVRMLKQGVQGITRWQPHKPQAIGWRWLSQVCTRAKDPRVTEVVHRPSDDDEDDNITPSASVMEMTSDRRKALYSSDGLTMSSRMLDSLIVQAFLEPFVYETVVALGSTYTHTITAQQWHELSIINNTNSGAVDHAVDDDDEGEGERERRSFRVELMLLDVPTPLVGRSFGFVQLLMMVEHGWVAMGLYRDKRTLAPNEPVMDGLASGQDNDGGQPAINSSPYEEQSPYFVFTNPPPDILLESTDRVYTLVQRWLNVDTAEAMVSHVPRMTKRAASPVDHPTAPPRSPPLTAPSIPLSYSPRVAPDRPTPALPVWSENF